jgi:ABC-type Zn2+ transport system substrate-binding protein/surface adhesin
MKKYVVKTVLVSVLLVPAGLALAKDLNTGAVKNAEVVQVEQVKLVQQTEVKDHEEHDDELASAECKADGEGDKEDHPIWKFWDDEDDDECTNRLSTPQDIKG